jgi:tetratricopeptide (TPR) repeat protein
MPKTGGARPQVQNPAVVSLQDKFMQGVALHQQLKLADAERIYIEVLQRQPDHFDALHLLGVVAIQTKRTVRGIELITKAIGLNAKVAAAHSNLGNALRELKRPQDALASYDRAIALKPDNAETYYNRGLALQDLKRPEDALASYDKAIALKPNFADAYNNRGMALRDLKRPEDVLASYDKVIALNPDYAEAHNNRGIALRDLKRPEDALASHDRAIALKPDYAEAYYNRGLALQDLRRPEDALASYDKAIALKPDYAEAYVSQGFCFLLMGRFEQGWRQYEWRKKENKPIAARAYPRPLWLGEQNIEGKTLFIHWEQGLGDLIQFCRYAKLAADLGARVILEVPKPLLSLLATLSGVAQLIEAGSPLPPFDYQCPLLSLPLAFKTTLSSIPATIPYLKANSEKSRLWKERLGERHKRKVGLVWSGGFRPNQPELWFIDSRRNIPLAKLAVLKHPDIDFYSLQKGEPAEAELAELIRYNWEGPHIVDFTSQLNDFSDTAALVENLDLVITVDTSTAHLAGAMGKPVWILNRFDTCWRWLLNRTDSPWYPTVKLYRQEKTGHWDDVVQRIRMDLDVFSAQHPEGNQT